VRLPYQPLDTGPQR